MVAIDRELITNFPTHQHNNFIVMDLACENLLQLVKQVLCFKKYLSVEIVFNNREKLTQSWKSYTTIHHDIARLKMEIQLMYWKQLLDWLDILLKKKVTILKTFCQGSNQWPTNKFMLTSEQCSTRLLKHRRNVGRNGFCSCFIFVL